MLRRLSDPYWFQAFGCVLGFDWHTRLHRILEKTRARAPEDFETLLGLEGVGAKTLRALALASELIYGAPASPRDPARFAFAHGGKDGTPFPDDRTIDVLGRAIIRATIDRSEKVKALRRLASFVRSNPSRSVGVWRLPQPCVVNHKERQIMKAAGLRRKIATLVLLCFCSWPLGVTAQRTIVMRPTTPANTLDTLVRTSDLMLQCTIAAAKSIVMDGTIYTDYDVVPKRTLLQTNLTSAGKPGEVSRIAFRKGGGTALLDGELVQMKSAEAARARAPRPPHPRSCTGIS